LCDADQCFLLAYIIDRRPCRYVPLHYQLKKMRVKETIAFIGAADNSCKELSNRLASAQYPLIFVANEGEPLAILSQQISDRMPQGDISRVECAKEGCWQADIIIFCPLQDADAALLQKIEAVTTRKILVHLSDKKDSGQSFFEGSKIFREALPNTQFVQLFPGTDPETMQVENFDDEAPVIIAQILKEAGYTILNEQKISI